MSGWEIACVVVGIIAVLGATEKYEVLIGSIMVLLPLYFNMWRN
jgi:hypothetical protein